MRWGIAAGNTNFIALARNEILTDWLNEFTIDFIVFWFSTRTKVLDLSILSLVKLYYYFTYLLYFIIIY